MSRTGTVLLGEVLLLALAGQRPFALLRRAWPVVVAAALSVIRPSVAVTSVPRAAAIRFSLRPKTASMAGAMSSGRATR